MPVIIYTVTLEEWWASDPNFPNTNTLLSHSAVDEAQKGVPISLLYPILFKMGRSTRQQQKQSHTEDCGARSEKTTQQFGGFMDRSCWRSTYTGNDCILPLRIGTEAIRRPSWKLSFKGIKMQHHTSSEGQGLCKWSYVFYQAASILDLRQSNWLQILYVLRYNSRAQSSALCAFLPCHCAAQVPPSAGEILWNKADSRKTCHGPGTQQPHVNNMQQRHWKLAAQHFSPRREGLLHMLNCCTSSYPREDLRDAPQGGSILTWQNLPQSLEETEVCLAARWGLTTLPYRYIFCRRLSKAEVNSLNQQKNFYWKKNKYFKPKVVLHIHKDTMFTQKKQKTTSGRQYPSNSNLTHR